MTVQELIAELQRWPLHQNKEIFIRLPEGDVANTTILMLILSISTKTQKGI